MVETTSLLLDLEETVAKGNPESCLRAMWHATDLLIAGTYSEDQIWTFGEIIGRLAQEIETTARAQLAGKLAASNNAPYKLTNQLASDDCIDVAPWCGVPKETRSSLNPSDCEKTFPGISSIN
jgi:hypothetical protein